MTLYRCDLVGFDGQVQLCVPVRRDSDMAAIEVGRQIFALCAQYAAFELWQSEQIIHAEVRPSPDDESLPPIASDEASTAPGDHQAMLPAPDNLRDLARRYALLAAADANELKPWQVAWLCWWQFIGRRKAVHKNAMTQFPHRFT
jgi:hypothetical protein